MLQTEPQCTDSFVNRSCVSAVTMPPRDALLEPRSHRVACLPASSSAYASSGSTPTQMTRATHHSYLFTAGGVESKRRTGESDAPLVPALDVPQTALHPRRLRHRPCERLPAQRASDEEERGGDQVEHRHRNDVREAHPRACEEKPQP